jgi:hypothetical protein
MIIIAETGGDMSVFEESGKIAGWAGLRQRNDESVGKYKKYHNHQRQQISAYDSGTGIVGCFKNEKLLV